jgi:hypothetical protein
VKKSVSTKPTKPSQYLDVKTFTYYIPAPPRRRTGFREREFDKIMHGILSTGHDVIDWKIQSVGGDEGGLYVIFLIGSTKKTAKGAGLDLHEKFGLTERHNDPNLEFIDNEE